MALTISAYKNNTVSSVSGITFTSNGTPFAASDVGRCVVMTSGAAIGQHRKISSYVSPSVVTIDYPWNISPFAQYKNDQTGLPFAEVLPLAGAAWSIITYLGDVADGVNIIERIPPKDANHQGGVYEQVGINRIYVEAGAFLGGVKTTLYCDASYMDIDDQAYVRWGDISADSYVYNSCNIIDASENWSPRRAWTNSASGDCGNFHMYGGTITNTYNGNTTAFSNTLWSMYRGPAGNHRFIGVRQTGEFGLRIEGTNSIVLDFVASGGDRSAYNKIHPIGIGLFKGFVVNKSKGALYWRVSDSNLVNVYDVFVTDIIDQLVYQTNSGTNAVFNIIGFKASQMEALPNVMYVSTNDPDGTLFLKNRIVTNVVDTDLVSITDPYKRVIWSPGDTLEDDATVTDGDWDAYDAIWWDVASTPTGFKGLADGNYRGPYAQGIISFDYLPNHLVETVRELSEVQFTAIPDPGRSGETKAVVDARTDFDNGEEVYDSCKSWSFDNFSNAFPTQGELLINALGSTLKSVVPIVFEDSAGSGITVDEPGNIITASIASTLVLGDKFNTIETPNLTTSVSMDGWSVVGNVIDNLADDVSNSNVTGDRHINPAVNSVLDYTGVTVSGLVYNDNPAVTLTINADSGSSLVAANPGTGNGQVNIVAGQVTLNLVDLPDGVEVRIRQGSYSLFHVQNASGGSESYTYTYSPDILVTVSVGGSGYVRQSIKYTLKSADSSLSFALEPDPSYLI